MPVHDWSRVDAGVFHAFHLAWLGRIQEVLNAEVLPAEYYALAEQRTAGFGPDVLTLQSQARGRSDLEPHGPTSATETTALLETPTLTLTGETDMEFYRRKQNYLAIRHITGDEIVAVIEVVSPGNKSSKRAMRAFVDKVGALLEQRIHLLIVDLHRPTARDPQGIHGVIWQEISGEEYRLPPQTPLTMAAYEADLSTRAYVTHMTVGDVLLKMPLFLEPRKHVEVPLERVYEQAFGTLPHHLQQVLAAD